MEIEVLVETDVLELVLDVDVVVPPAAAFSSKITSRQFIAVVNVAPIV